MRQNAGLEQGKEAGERGHISIPGIWKEEKQRTISHGVRMNAKSHQYLSLQLGATAEAHCSQGWDEASLKREVSFAIPQGSKSQTILAPQ